MYHSKSIASIQEEEFICSIKSSANFYIQQQSLNYMFSMMKHQILWVSCFCHSLNCINSKLCKFPAEITPVMESFYEVFFSN